MRMITRSVLAAGLLATFITLASSGCASPQGGARESGVGARVSIDARASDEAFLHAFASTYRYTHGRPKAITVTPNGDAVLYLRSGPRSFVQDLYIFDTATGTQRVLLTAEQLLGGEAEELTAEELARRERMRMASRGIASFSLSEDGSKILVPLSGRLFVYERAGGKISELKSDAGFPIDPRFSRDGTLVASVREGEVYVSQTDGLREWRVTQGAGGTVTHGLAEFVAQEEMSRFHGYWWSPDARRICYQRTDTAGLETFYIADPMNPAKEPGSWPYPRAGKQNADVRLGIIPTEGGETTWIEWDRAAFPYVASVTWPKNAPLTVLVQNRTQTRQKLLAVDDRTGATSVLLEEEDPAWINIFDSCPKWLADGSGFVWLTDSYGGEPGKDFPRLELRKRDGSLERVVTPEGFPVYDLLSLDSKGRAAYISHGPASPYTEVSRVSLDGGGPVLLAGGQGQFGAHFADNHSVYVETATTLAGELSWTVKREPGRAIIGRLTSAAEKPPFIPRPELTTVQVDGREHHAAIIRPRSFSQGRAYPVVAMLYTGPGVATVNANAMGYLLHQWMADQGFIVVAIDNRGTPKRGRAWERVIKNNLIDVALSDQAACITALGERYPEMDTSRVGVSGWSFGGYFAAMATMRRPDIFRCGVVGAPVCAWEDYDTHYTERYMGLPQDNPSGYAASNVLTYCKDLTVPLLIIHGTADDNVYFMHSLKMTEALFHAGKTFEFLPLAGLTHMVPDPAVTVRLQSRIAAFLRENLR
jgi:dipeptidyl-peptidase-4